LKEKVFPAISIVIPTYNAGRHLQRLLSSLQQQNYPWSKLEIIIVDDDSEDNTVSIARQFGARIVRNGHRHIERGKAIGLAAASNEFVLFLDADNYLPDPDWIATAVQPLIQDPTLVGAQSIRFLYNPADPPANRYCSLLGVNDPFAYYLRRRDRLTAIEKEWRLMGTVEDKGDYYIGTFYLPEVPTLGSQGFLTRKSHLFKVKHEPYLFHLEANLELIRQGLNRYVLLKMPVGHDHVVSLADFIRKCRRNIDLFYRWHHIRTYKWETSRGKLFMTVLLMITIVRPLWDAWQGFRKVKDWAWFLHPWLCLIIPVIYILVTCKWHLQPKQDKENV